MRFALVLNRGYKIIYAILNMLENIRELQQFAVNRSTSAVTSINTR